jgi:hypothetical protein
VLLIVYENVMYVWVGVEVKRETWPELIGVPWPGSSASFGLPEVECESALWVSIRSIRRLFGGLYVPVVVVPSESGKRMELLKILSHDYTEAENNLVKKYTAVARRCAGLS